MIITNRFVMLNFPKTGSTFARKMIKQVYKKYDRPIYRMIKENKIFGAPTIEELILPILDTGSKRKSQHGVYRQIPLEHRHKKIVSITRNPFDRYVSLYLFRWWVDHPYAPVEEIKETYPLFPNLDFSQFYNMLHQFGRKDRFQGASPINDMGFHSVQFVQFYFYNPADIFQKINASYIQQKHFLEDMPEIKFLHQENLNEELYNFLRSVGHSNKKIEFIKKEPKINVTDRASVREKFWNFYSPDLIEKIQKRDQLIFTLFPEYNYPL